MPDPVIGPVLEGDSFKAIAFHDLYDQKIMNVLHYVVADPTGTPPDAFQVGKELADALTAITTGIWTQLMVPLTDDLTLNTLRVQLLRGIEETYPFWDKAVGMVGGSVSNAAVANIAASIEKRATFDAGHPREGIGRLQLAGIPQDAYQAGLLDPTFIADFTNVLEDMSDPINLPSGVVLWPCLSRKGATNWIDNKIFQCTMKQTVRVMTRRTVGRGQ